MSTQTSRRAGISSFIERITPSDADAKDNYLLLAKGACFAAAIVLEIASGQTRLILRVRRSQPAVSLAIAACLSAGYMLPYRKREGVDPPWA